MSHNTGGKQADLSDNDSGGGLSVNAAQAKIEALLSGDEDSETPSAKPAKAAPPPNDEDDADGYEPTADDVGEPADDDEIVPETDEEDVEVDEDEVEPAAPQTRKHKAKVDGEDVEVTLEEALAGYSRTASFTKKSQALAEEKRQHTAAVQAKEAEIRAKQEHYVAQLAAVEEALQQPEPDWAEIQRDHPDEFANLHAAWLIHKGRVDNITAERQKEEAKLQEAYRNERAELVKGERAKLIEAVPLWGDTTPKGATFRRAVMDYGVAEGFEAKELNEVADHRALKILHKAYLYDQAEAAKKALLAKGKGKVEALKAIPPGSAPQGKRRTQTKVQVAKAQARKSGTVHDAAAAIEAMM